MTERENRKVLKLDPAQEFDRILSKLTTSPESIKEVERIVQTPDTQSRYNYEIALDPTGKQKVIEKFTTTMKQCSICGSYVPQTFVCENQRCGTIICANHRRRNGNSYFVCVSCYQSDQENQDRLNKLRASIKDVGGAFG